MALTELIAAKTAAETSSAVTLSGPTTFVADDLSIVDGVSEEVAIHRERVDGTFEALVIDRIAVVLTAHRPVITIEFYGDVKAVKGVTSDTVAVGYGS